MRAAKKCISKTIFPLTLALSHQGRGVIITPPLRGGDRGEGVKICILTFSLISKLHGVAIVKIIVFYVYHFSLLPHLLLCIGIEEHRAE
jgi:hypothetical protein